MRKVIAISVVLALVAGAAFAQTSISGTIDTRIRLANGSTAADDVTIGGPGVADGYVQLSGQDADGKFGGLVRIRANEGEGNFHRAFTWWQPIPQLRVFLGHDLDGKFGTDPLTAWGFHQGAEGYVERHDWDFWRAVFPGNWDGFGLALSFYIVQGLEINFVIPTGLPEWYPGSSSNASQTLTYQQILGSLRLQMNYAIPDLGKVYFSYIGPREDFGNDGIKNYGQIGGSFQLTAIEGLNVQLGVTTYLENDKNVDNSSGQYYPILVGLGMHFAAGDWGVKLRAAGSFRSYAGTRTTTDSWRLRPWIHWGVPFTEGTLVTFNVMPWYNFGALAAYFDIGADIAKPAGDTTVVDPYFWFNPYIRKSIGPGSIRAGLMIGVDSHANDANPEAVTTFSIPIQFTFSF